MAPSSPRGAAREAGRAPEEARLARLGTPRPAGPTAVLRGDDWLLFQSRRLRAPCRDYRLTQEFVTPHPPGQNGLIERFFRSLTEEWARQQTFLDSGDAWRAITAWLRWYTEARPHEALGYWTPRAYQAQHSLRVA